MYYLIYGSLYVFSKLPWFVLYGISDLLAFLTYYVFGYRKKVVLGNLAIAFPDKTVSERKEIAKQFYRNFSDTLAETIKMITASDEEVEQSIENMVKEDPDRADNIRRLFTLPQPRESLRDMMVINKAMDYLTKLVTGQE